jgi:hypothetical protein
MLPPSPTIIPTTNVTVILSRLAAVRCHQQNTLGKWCIGMAQHCRRIPTVPAAQPLELLHTGGRSFPRQELAWEALSSRQMSDHPNRSLIIGHALIDPEGSCP